MSYYGTKTFPNLFSIHKQRLAAGQSYRFGGAQSQLAYDAVTFADVEVKSDPSGVNIVDAGTDIVNVVLMGLKRDADSPFSNVSFVEISGNYVLPADKYGVVLEGSLQHNEYVLDSNTDLHLLESGSTVDGTGKIVEFTLAV